MIAFELLSAVRSKTKVRIDYPRSDKPLFVYKAISMSDYDWSNKTVSQKLFSYLLAAIFFFGCGYVAFVSATNHLITWTDLSWMLVWRIFKCVLIVAAFPAILFPVMFFLREKYPTSPTHEFFRDWARVYTGIGRGGIVSFFAEDVAHMHLERIVFRDRPFFLVTVHFKPWNFPLPGRRGRERFGLPVNTEAELQPFRDWTRANQIRITQEPVGKIQRRS